MDLTTFVPSPLQANILNWLRTGEGHAFVQAVAGSGKSTTLEWSCRSMPEASGILIAFNKSIATELQSRLSGTNFRASTVHSQGYKACAEALPRNLRLKLESRKYTDMVFPVVKALAYNKPNDAVIMVDGQEVRFNASPKQSALMEVLFSEASKLVKGMAEKGRLTLTDLSDPKALDRLVTGFGLEPNWGGKLSERREFLANKLSFRPGSDFWGRKLVQCQGLVDMYFDDRAAWMELRESFLHLCAHIAATAIRRGYELFRGQGVIDFTDMIWLPVTLDLPVETAPFVFADEVQDFSPLQRAFLARMIGPTTRGLFVGDEDQSIYAFTGADVDSVRNLVAEFACTTLPLSVTYRCPTSVVALARQFQGAGNITPRDGAPLGRVSEVDWDGWTPTPGDLVLCRTTRPLVATCWWLLQRSIPAYVEGQSIGAGLVKVAKVISSRPNFTWADFLIHANDEFTARQENILLKNGGDADDERIDAARDEIASVKMLWEIDQPDSGAGFTATVDRLFAAVAKDDNSRVRLATGHRAKGLEADHVYLLKPQKMPHVMGSRTASGAVQERNLQYVVATRAQSEFTFVVGLDPTEATEGKDGADRDVSWPEAAPFLTSEDSEEDEIAAVEAAVATALSDEPEGDDPDDDPEGGETIVEVIVESTDDTPDKGWVESTPEYAEDRLLVRTIESYQIKVRIAGNRHRVECYDGGTLEGEGFWCAEDHVLEADVPAAIVRPLTSALVALDPLL